MKNILTKIFSSKAELNSKEKSFLEITKKTALNAIKVLNKKYKNYWCILSKTI